MCNCFFYKKILLLLVIIRVSFVIYTFSQSFEVSVFKIKKQVEFVHQHLKIGTIFTGLSKQKFLQYGYASCTDFVLFLKDQLADIGFVSRIAELFLFQTKL